MIEVIEYYNWVVSEWLRLYYVEGTLILLAIISFVYLFMSCKALRNKFLLPIFLMLLVTVNPILHAYIYRRIVFWRLFWMLPIAVLIAAAIVVLLKRLDKVWMKWIVLLMATGFIVSQGQYMFTYGVFFPRSNWEKVSQETIEVSDIMLEYDKSPRAIVHSPINTEVRQYAPEVQLLYGRDIGGYIREKTIHGSMVSYMLVCSQYKDALCLAQEKGYSFIVMQYIQELPEAVLAEYGYKEIARTTEHIIYYNEEIEYVSEVNK